MKSLSLLIPYLKKYKLHLLFGLIFVTISNICSTIVPRQVGNAIDVISKGDFTNDDIIIKIVTILLLTLFSGLFMFMTRQTIIVSSRLIEYDLRHDFVVNLESRDMGFFTRNSTGTLMAYATNDITAAREFLGPAIMYGANTLTTFSFAMYFMLNLDVEITLLSLIPLPIIAVSTYYIGQKIHIAYTDVQQQFSVLSENAQESFSGIRLIKSYLREKHEGNEFRKNSSNYSVKNLRLARIYSFMMPLFVVLVGIAQLIVLGFGGYKVMNGAASLGTLTQFFIYINLLIWPVAAIGWVTSIIQRAAASCARLLKLLDRKDEVNETGTSQIISGDIEFRNVTLKFDDREKEVLSGISLDVPAGSSLGIVGTIGSGKTCLVNLLPRLFDPSGGEVLINSINLNEYPMMDLRKSIAVVPQDVFLFSATIEENIRFGQHDASIEDVKNAATAAGLNHDIEAFPDSYNTMLGERGISLSGGQKQRLALARAIIRNPQILILDDALSSVDSRTEELVLRNIKELMPGRTTIIISHRFSAIEHCDNIIYMENGAIIESGNHVELLKLKTKYCEAFQRQQLEEEIELM